MRVSEMQISKMGKPKKKKVIDKNNEKCYFVEVVIQFVHSRVTTEEIENRMCDLNNVGC